MLHHIAYLGKYHVTEAGIVPNVFCPGLAVLGVPKQEVGGRGRVCVGGFRESGLLRVTLSVRAPEVDQTPFAARVRLFRITAARYSAAPKPTAFPPLKYEMAHTMAPPVLVRCSHLLSSLVMILQIWHTGRRDFRVRMGLRIPRPARDVGERGALCPRLSSPVTFCHESVEK